MRLYGHIFLTKPMAQTAKGLYRSPMRGTAALPVHENPCKNTVKSLCMCGFILNTQRKNLYETIPCILFSSVCKAKIIPIYSFLTHAVLRVPVSDTGTAVASMGFISFELMHLLKKMLCACFLFMAVIPMAAQEGDAQGAENTSSWYVGLQGGVPSA